LKISDAIAESQRKRDPHYEYINHGETAELHAETDKRIRNERDLIEALNIDTDTWEIEKFTVGKSEGYRKDRKVSWETDRGVSHGTVEDSGLLLIEPMFAVKVFLRRKTQEIRNRLVVDDIKKDLKKFAPKYSKIKYSKIKDALLYEIAAFDFHIGKLTWAEESGENSDLKTQVKRVTEVFDELLSHAKNYPIEKILIPFGGDFYNSDNKFDSTTALTPQSEDTRWQKTFRAGRILAVTLIDKCSQIAPVDVLVLSGNHDETRSFFLGDALESWYHGNKNVTIDNSARRRKYYKYGRDLLMFVHGSEEKMNKLPGIMAMEEPMLWADTKFREIHCGDKHHREDVLFKTHEAEGVVVRLLSSLSPTDAWHASKGFIGALQASQSFLWSKDNGMIAQFIVTAKPNTD
jgi:hypothetical protein